MAGRSDVGAMEAFVADLSVDTFAHVIDEDGSIWAQFDVVSQPSFAFINDDGTITTHTGALGHAQLNARIEDLRAS